MATKRNFKEEFLTCSLCTNAYDNETRVPKCLPCLHCFCKSCLIRHIDGKPNVKCPQCRKHCVVPEGGADGFVTNFNVENLRDYQSLHQEPRIGSEGSEGSGERVLCNSCAEDNPATGYCYECESYICHKCTDMHAAMRGLRAHEIESLENLMRPNRPLKRRPTGADRCRDHNQPCSIFCKTCNKPICGTCALIAPHDNHQREDLNSAIKQTSEALNKLSQTVRKKKEPLEKLSGMIGMRINEINAVFGRREEIINKLFEAIEKKLRDRCTQAQEELQGHCKGLNNLLKEQADEVEAMIAQYDSACDFADQACEHASAKQLFKHEEMVRQSSQRKSGIFSS